MKYLIITLFALPMLAGATWNWNIPNYCNLLPWLPSCQQEEPVDEPTEEPVEEPTEEPVDEPVEEPTEEPNEEPTDEPVEEPTEEPAEEPSEDPNKDTSKDLGGSMSICAYTRAGCPMQQWMFDCFFDAACWRNIMSDYWVNYHPFGYWKITPAMAELSNPAGEK